MKTKVLIGLFILITLNVFTQTPDAIKYQALVRGGDGYAITESDVGFQIEILQGSISGTVIYAEEHTRSTNKYGIANINIGRGTSSVGDFSTISWGDGPYYIRMSVDEEGGSDYELLGVSQILAVPYALYATKAKSLDSMSVGQVLSYSENADGYKISNLGNPDDDDDAINGAYFTEVLDKLFENFNANDIDALVYGLTDSRDGKIYETTKIGDDIWMAENLNVGEFVLGSQTDNSIIEKFCYDDFESNCDEYGGLYKWDEVMDYSTTEGVQGICPDGWHLPTQSEWQTMISNIGGSSGGGAILREVGLDHWETGATKDTYHFSARGAGKYDGSFSELRQYAYFWTSTEGSVNINGVLYKITDDHDNINADELDKQNAFSVRCVKD